MNIENREISQKLVDIIDFLKQSISKLSVYDLNYYSMSELYYNIAKKINELIEAYHEFGVSISEEVIKQNECLQYLLNEGLNTEVVNKINQMVIDGSFNKIINQEVFGKINKELSEKATKTELEVERARINNIIQLPSGSTTGDAELIDGRIGIDGVVYNTLGEAIRSQISYSKVNNYRQFILGNITTGKYVSSNNGVIATEPSYSYGVLNLTYTGYIKVRFLNNATDNETNYNQIAFFNGDNFISGFDSLGAIGDILVPPGTTKVYYSFPNSYTGRISFEIGSINIVEDYMPNKYFDMKKDIEDIKFSKANNFKKHLFKNKIEGKFISFNNGQIGTEPSYCYASVEVNNQSKGKILFLDYATSVETDYNQLAFFNGDTYISGYNASDTKGEFIIPNGTTMIYYSYPISYLGRVVIELKNDDSNVKKITVSKDSSTFPTIESALSYAYSDFSKDYEIFIKAGTYEEGMFDLRGNISLIGENKETTIIKTRGINYSGTINSKHCFMNTNDTGKVKIKNLQLDCLDVKYCIHLDNESNLLDVEIENCKFKNNHPSIGMGLWSNQNVIVDNCDFEFIINNDYSTDDYDWNFGVYMHNWYNSTIDCNFTLKNSRFINCKILDHDLMINNLCDKIKVINCTSNLWNIISFRGYDNVSSNLRLIGDYNLICDYSKFNNPNYHCSDVYAYNSSSNNLPIYTPVEFDYTVTSDLRRKFKQSVNNVDGILLTSTSSNSYGYVLEIKKGVAFYYKDGIVGKTYLIDKSGINENSTNYNAICFDKVSNNPVMVIVR